MTAQLLHDAAQPALSRAADLHEGCTTGCTNLPERAARGAPAAPQARGRRAGERSRRADRAEVLGEVHDCTTGVSGHRETGSGDLALPAKARRPSKQQRAAEARARALLRERDALGLLAFERLQLRRRAERLERVREHPCRRHRPTHPAARARVASVRGDRVTSRCHASEALRRCARCRQADEQNRLSLRPLRTFPHPAHDLDGPSDAAPVVSSSRCRSRRIDRAEASRWSTIHGSACMVISVGGSWKTGQPSTTFCSRLAGSLRAMRATLRMLAVTAWQGVAG